MLTPEAKISPSTAALREQLTQVVARAELPKSFQLNDAESKQLSTFMQAWISTLPTEREPLLNKKLRRTVGKGSLHRPREAIELAGKYYELPFSVFINHEGECFLLTHRYLGSGAFCRAKLAFTLNMEKDTLTLGQPKALLRYAYTTQLGYFATNHGMNRTQMTAKATLKIYGSEESEWNTNFKNYVTMPFIAGKAFDENTLGRGHKATIKEYQLAIAYILAVQIIHENGIIHGDIKFLNFLVTDNNSQPIAFPVDFDFSDDALNPQKQGISRGTPSYMAPEASEGIKGVIQVTQASDIWSLGIMLVLLLANRDQHYDAFLQEIKKKFPAEAVAKVKALSLAETDLFDEVTLLALLSQMFNTKPSERLTHHEFSKMIALLHRTVTGSSKPQSPLAEEKKPVTPVEKPAAKPGVLGTLAALRSSVLFGKPAEKPADPVAIEQTPQEDQPPMTEAPKPFDSLFG